MDRIVVVAGDARDDALVPRLLAMPQRQSMSNRLPDAQCRQLGNTPLMHDDRFGGKPLCALRDRTNRSRRHPIWPERDARSAAMPA